MKEKMKVSDFVEQYKKASNDTLKQRTVKQIMKRSYCPILEKKLMLQIMLDKSIIVQDNGIKYIDMFLSKMNLIAAIIGLYTNLEYEKDGNGIPKTFEAYDMLKATGALSDIYAYIGETELNEITSVNGMLMETFYNQNGTEAFIANQVTRFGGLVGGLVNMAISKLGDVLENDNVVSKVMAGLDGLTKQE